MATKRAGGQAGGDAARFQRRMRRALVAGTVCSLGTLGFEIFVFLRPDIFSFLFILAVIIIVPTAFWSLVCIVALAVALSGVVKGENATTMLMIVGLLGCGLAVFAALPFAVVPIMWFVSLTGP
jgi:hypothetical protein